MLRVTVEVVPYGDGARTESLTTLYIGNDGSGVDGRGNYDVYVKDPRGQARPRMARDGWIGRIEGHDRSMVTSRGRDVLSAKALMLVTTPFNSAGGAAVVPGGWMVMHRCSRTHFMGPNYWTLCGRHNRWDVFCRAGDLSPAHCKACEKALTALANDAA